MRCNNYSHFIVVFEGVTILLRICALNFLTECIQLNI